MTTFYPALSTSESLMAALRSTEDGPQPITYTPSEQATLISTLTASCIQAEEDHNLTEQQAISSLIAIASALPNRRNADQPHPAKWSDDTIHLTIHKTGTRTSGWPFISWAETQAEPTPLSEPPTELGPFPEDDIAQAAQDLADAILRATIAERPDTAQEFHLTLKRLTCAAEGQIYRILHLPE